MNENLKIIKVKLDNEFITLNISDGRIVSTPLEIYPRLLHATQLQKDNFVISAAGRGIHWEDLDEDLSMEGIINGIPSIEYKKDLIA